MKKSRLIILLVLLLAALGGLYFVNNVYNKEHIDVAETEADETMSSEDLFAEFDGNEEMAMESYSDKIIQVKGSITSIELANEAEPQIVLYGNGVDGFIRCGFKTSELDKIKALTDSSIVSLKGLCMGLNGSDGLDLLADKDVILSNCIIIE
jgi:hypothetical protein